MFELRAREGGIYMIHEIVSLQMPVGERLVVKKNRLEQYGIEYIEINLSVVQCAYTYLADDFIKIIGKSYIKGDD